MKNKIVYVKIQSIHSLMDGYSISMSVSFVNKTIPFIFTVLSLQPEVIKAALMLEIEKYESQQLEIQSLEESINTLIFKERMKS